MLGAYFISKGKGEFICNLVKLSICQCSFMPQLAKIFSPKITTLTEAFPRLPFYSIQYLHKVFVYKVKNIQANLHMNLAMSLSFVQLCMILLPQESSFVLPSSDKYTFATPDYSTELWPQISDII